MTDTAQRILQTFRDAFGGAPAHLVRAPGRVNLIGEHTDYNDGFVLPIAIDRSVWLALRPRTDDQVVVHAADYGEQAAFGLDGVERGEGWIEYVKGVAWALQERGYALHGWEGVLGGDVPSGAGLSSSAAVELAVARAFAVVSDFAWEAAPMALLGQRVENEWLGVNSGIMDQMIVASGRPGRALLLDCRSLESTFVPLPSGVAVLVLDTGTRRGLVGSAYNERRSRCEEAARAFGVPALRDLDEEAFAAGADRLDPVTRRRARHVVTENARTLVAADALRRGDAVRFGELMDASHASLRDDFEVSSPALDRIVELTREHPDCLGARMTGAGFGGCAVALVEAGAADEVARAVAPRYEAATRIAPRLYVCRAAAGVGLEAVPS